MKERMKEIIEELTRIKAELVTLYEKHEDMEHNAFLVGDCIVVIEDRISHCENIVKNGVIFRDAHGEPLNQYPGGIAHNDYFHKDDA